MATVLRIPWAVRIAVLLLLVLVSCAQEAAPTATPTSAPAAAPSPSPAVTPSPSPSPTSTPTPVRTVVIATPTATARPAPTPTPTAVARKPEGTLNYTEFSFDTESWIPWELGQGTYGEPVGEYLVDLDPVTWALKPGLAKSWQIADDGLTLTYQLQERVPFHENWGEMTSDDVVYSLYNYVYNPDSTHPVVQVLKEANATFTAVGKYTVRVNFTRPYLTAILDLSTSNLGSVIASKAYMEKVGVAEARRKLIATGPYRLKEHRLGVEFVIEALDTHWKQVGLWKNIKYLVAPEATTRLAQVLTGEADISSLPGSFKRQLSAAGATKVRAVLNPGVAGIFLIPVVYIPGTTAFTTPDPGNPMADPKFREALSLAINRQELADVVYAGGAVPTGQTDLMPISLGYDPAFEKPDPYDPARAQQLLKEIGKAGLRIKFDAPDVGGVPELAAQAEAIAGMWEKVGLKVDLRVRLINSVYQDSRRGRKLEGTVWQFRLGHLVDTSRRFSSQFRCQVDRTILFTCDERMEKLTQQIEQTATLAEKSRLLNEAYKLLLSQRIVIPTVQTANLYALGPKVGEWQFRIGERFATELMNVGHAK